MSFLSENKGLKKRRILKVRLFGILKKTIGCDELTAPDTLNSVTELESWLVESYPDLKEQKKYWRVAVNQEYVTKEAPLEPSCEVALLPPVSGG